ncbi:unnamed protein product [Paramecium primaurelia]|uniref:Acyl-CoA dehydrogenase n=1 Tax=Paramecium primaurelia TaxID=5886 RepID=A0A8S1L8D5_PARPR|nr:unnamed protein product [Paramecium primaurelia]
MIRLNQLAGQVKEKKAQIDPMEYLSLYDLLTPEELEVRKAVEAFVAKEVTPKINDYVEAAQFPTEIVNAVKPLKLFHHFLNKPYGHGTSYTKQGIILMEAARADAGFATFIAVQNLLLNYTLEKFGSEAQKQKYLTKTRDIEYIGGWGLTEKGYGSDASSLTSNVKKVQGGYILNGDKRWIGNGNKDVLIVWARNLDTNKVEGFIVETKWPGYHAEVIQGKLALRIVQNCQITFTNIFIPDENKLESVTDFQNGPNQVLMHSRVIVPWIALGVMRGVYEHSLKWTTTRKQFGKYLASFQLQQERLVRILSTFQASFLMVLRLSRLAAEGKATIGMISSVKAWVTDKTREVARLGREMLGGDGIISDNYVIKALTDAEVLYTYEGTYDINSLVAGREITGIGAFK